MQTIIQLSDFHILLSDPKPQDNSIFVGMINAIKKIPLGEKPILIYNGDFIYYNDINGKIAKSKAKTRSDEQKRKYYMKKAFDHAGEYFSYLFSELGIEKENVVLCCGNHDVIGNGVKTIDVECPKGKTVKIEEDRFELFSKLCFRLTGRKECEHTQLYKIRGFNILVQNSNWADKWIAGVRQAELCINCTEVVKKITENETLLRNAGNERNIFVSHAPPRDYCENGHYSFPETQDTAVMPKVNQFFDLKLYGDKHTQYIDRETAIVGAPLDDKETSPSVAIYEFDNNNKRHQITIEYLDGKWNTFGAENDVEEILSISKAFIKDRAKEYLFGSKHVDDFAMQIKGFDSIRNKPNWNYLNSLFCSSAKIIKQGTYPEIDLSKNDYKFIETLTDFISDSHSPIVVKGEPRLGKSICLSVLYFYLLNQYVSRAFPFIPLYFDIEKAISIIEEKCPQVNRDTSEANRLIMEQFCTFLQKGIQYAEESGHRLCCIIDGINENRLYDNNRIEDSILDRMEEYSRITNGKDPLIARVINCVDTNSYAALARVPQAEIEAGYEVRFKPIRSNYAGKSPRFADFVQAFAMLQSATEEEKGIVVHNINSLGISLVDTNLLVHFWNDLKEKGCKSYYELMGKYTRSLLTADQLKNATKACFDYTVCCKPYSDTFLQDGSEMHNKEFDFVRTQRMVTNYLLACHYVEMVDKYRSKSKETPIECDDLNCLDRLYGHDVCFFIRDAIYAKDMARVIERFTENHIHKLSFKGISTISYLIGRSKLSPDKKKALLRRAGDAIADKQLQTEDDRFLREVANRSIRLSMPQDHSDSDPMTDYIHTLIGDDYQRRVNSMFYLQYYGDRMESSGEGRKQEFLLRGFDFFKTYHILASRLLSLDKEEKWNDHRDMHRLELFTLCDIIQIRIDIPNCVHKEDVGTPKTVATFFYDENYNVPKSNLARERLSGEVKIVIDRYIKWFEDSEDPMFISYLKLCQASVDAASKMLENGPLPKDKMAFIPNRILKKVSGLKGVKRVGWNINKTPNPNTKMKVREIKKLQSFTDVHETTLEHTFEACIIALFYLPDEKTREEYDKQKIIKMLFIHDLGEVSTGDILPSFEDYVDRRRNEDLFCRALFVQSIHNDISNLNEYYDLWHEWKTESYNGKVAKDIDRLQRLIKMLQLFSKGEIGFTEKRIKEFWDDSEKLKTDEGKKLFEVLISADPDFKEIRKKHNLKDLI